MIGSSVFSFFSRRKWDKMLNITALHSIKANLEPMQFLGPESMQYILKLTSEKSSWLTNSERQKAKWWYVFPIVLGESFWVEFLWIREILGIMMDCMNWNYQAIPDIDLNFIAIGVFEDERFVALSVEDWRRSPHSQTLTDHHVQVLHALNILVGWQLAIQLFIQIIDFSR